MSWYFQSNFVAEQVRWFWYFQSNFVAEQVRWFCQFVVDTKCITNKSLVKAIHNLLVFFILKLELLTAY